MLNKVYKRKNNGLRIAKTKLKWGSIYMHIILTILTFADGSVS